MCQFSFCVLDCINSSIKYLTIFQNSKSSDGDLPAPTICLQFPLFMATSSQLSIPRTSVSLLTSTIHLFLGPAQRSSVVNWAIKVCLGNQLFSMHQHCHLTGGVSFLMLAYVWLFHVYIHFSILTNSPHTFISLFFCN